MDRVDYASLVSLWAAAAAATSAAQFSPGVATALAALAIAALLHVAPGEVTA